jgi:NADH dehydrogenase/NADH:ubiquinone oxidoreductase subunit G
LSYKQSNILREKIKTLDLSMAAGIVAYALSTVMPLEKRDRQPQVSIETLMTWTNTSKNTVRKGLKELQQKGVIAARPGKRTKDSEGKIRSEATHYTWALSEPASSEHWHSADVNKVAAASIVIDEKAQNIDLNRGSQIDPVKESEREPIQSQSSKDWQILATLVQEALERNPESPVSELAKAMTEKPKQVAEKLEQVMTRSKWHRANFMSAALSRTPELFLPELRKSPYVSSRMEYVAGLHNLGEHFDCRPGEFGHPEGEPIELDLLPVDSSPWANFPWVGKG